MRRKGSRRAPAARLLLSVLPLLAGACVALAAAPGVQRFLAAGERGLVTDGAVRYVDLPAKGSAPTTV